jgi:drug/metabolite transporter (DMT)-like permease/cell division septum initiation protein DivIVA
MGRLDNLPENTRSADSTANEILKSVTQDLRSLQQGVVAQLTQDVSRLQAEKSRLLDEIDQLQAQHRSLQTQHQTALSQQQIAQQQLWAKQLAQALAKQLHVLLSERIQSHALVQSEPANLLPPAANRYGEDATRMLVALDTTLNRTLSSVRQDLNSYQSSLSQQISRMHNLEQQGEAILEALVSRLHQQLQSEVARMQTTNRAEGNGHPIAAPSPSQPHPSTLPRPTSTTILPVAPVVAPEPTVAPVRSMLRPGLSQFQIGFLLILLSTVALSLHNVVVGVIGNASRVLGIYEVGGYISLNSLGNSLLILCGRMVVVLLLMTPLSAYLYPPVWRDIRVFVQSKDRRLLRSVIGSGFFLFLSQVLIYIAIGQIGPGVAVTILFMYPIITVPLAWLLFGDRPTGLRTGVMMTILLGVILTAFPNLIATANISWLGISTAVVSGIAFAFYLIAMQISFRKLHPVPVSLIQFATIFVFTSLSLILFPDQLGVEIIPQGLPGLIRGGILLGSLTLIGYLLNNFGVRLMGAARASIVAASGPVLTALLAFLLIPGARTALQGVQWLGILIVTIGVVALSFERMLIQNKAAKPANAN